MIQINSLCKGYLRGQRFGALTLSFESVKVTRVSSDILSGQ